MTDTRFLLVISIFTGVAAVALLIQMFLLWGLYVRLRSTQTRLVSLADRLEPIIDATRRLAEETRQNARDIFGKLHDISETTRLQVLRIDELLSEVSAHTRANLDRIDRLAENAAQRVEETLTQLQRTILAPVRSINGAAAAVRAVVHHLAGKRAQVDGRATQEEDLFI